MDKILIAKIKNPMKRHFSGQILLAFLTVAAALCLGLGIAWSAEAENGAPKAAPTAGNEIIAPATDELTRAPDTEQGSRNSDLKNTTILPTEKELGPNALETYTYLLFIQAILDENEPALLALTPQLAQISAPVDIWLDGGVWLTSRKSLNTIAYLEQALKALPDDLSLNMLYAEALADHGMAGRGAQVMQDYLAKHPDALDARLEFALLLVKDGKFDEALKILSAVNAKQRTPLVDYYQAKALMGMKKRAEAIPYLRKAIKAMPDFIEALADLAFMYEQEGNLHEARATYEKLQKINFSPKDVALRLINVALKMNRPELALKYINQGPDSLPFKLGAAGMLIEARHYLQAEVILKKIAEQKDAPAEVFLLLAELVFEQRRNLNLALSWLDRIPENSRGADRAAMLRIQLMAESGKMAEALKQADESCRQYPDVPDLAELRIRLLAREKKFDNALTVAKAAVDKWPENMSLKFLLGSILDEKGSKKEALQVMEEIIKKQPDHFQALNYVGYTLAEENRDLQRALELLTKADSLSPNQAYIVDSLAWALFKAQRGDEALTQIRRAIALDGKNDAAIWEHYGDIAAKQGKKDEARRAYRKAIELKPANVKEIRARLSAL